MLKMMIARWANRLFNRRKIWSRMVLNRKL